MWILFASNSCTYRHIRSRWNAQSDCRNPCGRRSSLQSRRRFHLVRGGSGANHSENLPPCLQFRVELFGYQLDRSVSVSVSEYGPEEYSSSVSIVSLQPTWWWPPHSKHAEEIHYKPKETNQQELASINIRRIEAKKERRSVSYSGERKNSQPSYGFKDDKY